MTCRICNSEEHVVELSDSNIVVEADLVFDLLHELVVAMQVRTAMLRNQTVHASIEISKLKPHIL